MTGSAAVRETRAGRASLSLAHLLVYMRVMHGFFGTAAPCTTQLAIVAPFPFIVWGADELRRLLVRRLSRRSVSN